MSAAATTAAPVRARTAGRGPQLGGALATLVGRRLALTIRTPRELAVPLLTPLLFALVIAPALRQALHAPASYESYVATGTVGLLIPLNTMFAGLGVIGDRERGAQRELLASPVPRSLLVAANVVVAVLVTALQVAVLLSAANLRGIAFDVSAGGAAWCAAAGLLFAVGMAAAGEALAASVPGAEEYIANVPAVAIVPWFLAGSLFPISALPLGLAWIARFLPLTHALALVRYGLLSDPGGLHAIWRGQDAATMAALSLAVVSMFAVLLSLLAVRRFAARAVG